MLQKPIVRNETLEKQKAFQTLKRKEESLSKHGILTAIEKLKMSLEDLKFQKQEQEVQIVKISLEVLSGDQSPRRSPRASSITMVMS